MNKNSLSYAIIGLSIVTISGIIIAKMFFGGIKGACPDDRQISNLLVILIDRTDRISPTTKEDVYNRIIDYLYEVPIGTKVEVYSVGSNDVEVNKPVISVCNMGDGKNESGIVTNRKRKYEKFVKQFEMPVKTELDKLLIAETSVTSPILESMQAVYVKSFQRYKNAFKSLILVTDGLQNTKSLSFYQAVPPWESIRKTFIGSTLNTDLSNCKVDMLIIQRQENVKQMELLHDFWGGYIAAMGGTLSTRILLSGNN